MTDNKSNNNQKDIDIEIAIMFAEGYSKAQIARQLSITYEKVTKTLKKKLVNDIIKDRQEQIRKTIHRAYSKVDDKLIQMVDMYTDEALLDERIEKTPLRDLFNVLASFSNRYEVLQKHELELKRLEIEKERLMLERERLKSKDTNIDNDVGIIKEFYNNLFKSASPLKKDK